MTSSGRSFNDIKLVFLGITIMLLACSYIADAMVKNIIIGNTGVILPLFEVTASSGSAADIQTAVDQVAAVAERGKVHIPPGNFNFVNVGEEWRTVNVPAGIDILGASSPKEAVSEHAGITHSGYFNEGFFDSPSSGTWLTVLQMPWDVPDFNNWFDIIGDWHSPKPTRFSDIKIQGYRSFNSSSITRHCGINIIGVIDFRIDHCMFEHVTWGAVGIPLLYQQNLECNGVIDHCKFINIHGYDNLVNGANSTIGYGISIGRAYYAASGQVPVPFDPTMDILGKYNTHAVFIEDCYFSKWRHCVTAHHGGYYVFRHNIINLDFGHWSLDVHGLRDAEPNRCGGRGVEIYENVFGPTETTDEGAVLGHGTYIGVGQFGGGCGVFFNNIIDSSYTTLKLYPEDYVPSEIWHIQDWYMWSKKGTWIGNCDISAFDPSRNVVKDWARDAGNSSDPNYPNVNESWAIAGYVPYTYPHPLTLG